MRWSEKGIWKRSVENEWMNECTWKVWKGSSQPWRLPICENDRREERLLRRRNEYQHWFIHSLRESRNGIELILQIYGTKYEARV
jgi:hypothetical protein